MRNERVRERNQINCPFLDRWWTLILTETARLFSMFTVKLSEDELENAQFENAGSLGDRPLSPTATAP